MTMKVPPLVVAALLLVAQSAVALVVQTPATRAHFLASLPAKPDAVALGGWHAMESASTSQLAAANYAKWKPYMTSLDVVQAGGYATVQALCADPKGSLVQLIVDGKHPQHLTALVGILQAQGKGYDNTLVDGEWVSVLNVSGQKSPKLQRVVEKMEKKGKTYSNFNVDQGIFTGNAKVLFGLGDLGSTVKFTPVADNFDKVGNKIVLRRIACDIVGASWKFWKLPRIPLGLKKKGGFLDFVFLDKDVRLTKGNRGGVFVHFRPSFLNAVTAAKKRRER